MMDINAFFDDRPTIPSGRGGKRPNAGRKGNVGRQPNADGEKSAYAKYEEARAEKELHAARSAAVKADLDEAAVVEIEAVATAAAQAFAACSQSLDAIGDMLEREGIPIEVCERVTEIINGSKQALAEALERLHDGSQ